MGTHGTEAARQYVMESAAYMENLAAATGTRDLTATITQLAAVAREFEQAEAFSAVIDSISDGSPEQEWIRIEAALAFGDYITAREVLRVTGEGIEDQELHSLMESTVDRHTIHSPYSSGLNIMDTALAGVIGSMDQNSPGLQWMADIRTADILTEMTGLASMGEVMAAVSMGSIMAEVVTDGGGPVISGLAEKFAGDPDGAKRTALWYILSMDTFSPAARAVLLTDIGQGELAYNILVSETGMAHSTALEAAGLN